MLSVTDIASRLGISKQAVYKRFKKPHTQPFIRMVDGVQYLTDEGFQRVFSDYVQPQDSHDSTGAAQLGGVGEQPTIPEEVRRLYEDLIEQQKAEINRLVEQLNGKDAHIGNLARMLDQSQVLQKQLQDQVLMLTQPAAERPAEEKPQERPPSLWERLTGRR